MTVWTDTLKHIEDAVEADRKRVWAECERLIPITADSNPGCGWLVRQRREKLRKFLTGEMANVTPSEQGQRALYAIEVAELKARAAERSSSDALRRVAKAREDAADAKRESSRRSG